MVNRYVIIDNATDACLNSILWDGVSPWTPPAGCRVEQDDTRQVDPVIVEDPKMAADRMILLKSAQQKTGLTNDEIKALTGVDISK